MNPRAPQPRHLLLTTGGSLVVCLVTPAAVYLSADSRYACAPVPLRDSARKLLPCGPTALCGLSGLLRFTRIACDPRGDDFTRETTFELSDVVDGLQFNAATGEEPGLAEKFAQRFYQALLPIWERFAIGLDEPFGGTAPAESPPASPLRLAQLFYVNRASSGRTFLTTIDLKHSVHRSDSGHYSSVLGAPVIRQILHNPVAQPRLYVRGARSCASPEPLNDAIRGDTDALRVIESVFAGARRETRCAARIGGPVDVAVIDASGRRWLRQKPERPNGHQ